MTTENWVIQTRV